ncbi:MAG: LLM class flavin-dependent oxidoreductase [Pseudomonadota bacterium]
MSEIELGIGLSRLDDVAGSAQRAEALGYDFVVTGEHVFFYGPINNGLISLAAAAGATSTIKLMSTITLVPLYPAALLAKQVASLDMVSNGRFNLGVGVGGEFAKEFEACGVPVKERGARTNESLDILTKLFSEDHVEYQGKFNSIPGLTLSPKPKQTPLPIWISGRSEAAKTRCARFGTGWLPYMYTPEQLESSLVSINTQAADFDRKEPIRPGLFIFFAVHEDSATAIDMAAERLSKQYNQDFSKLVHKYAIAGNPDECVARLSEYIDAGAQTIILNSACPGGYTGTNEQLMAQSVLPRIKGN